MKGLGREQESTPKRVINCPFYFSITNIKNILRVARQKNKLALLLN